MKIIFFGTPSFAVIILGKLMRAGLRPVAVVTTPDRPAGRGHNLAKPPAKICSEKNGIPVYQPEKLKDEKFLQTLRDYNADVFVIASYGKILPKQLLDIPPKGTINVHPSLLPLYRGPSPIQTIILHGGSHAGVTVMLTDEKMDHGPILARQKLEFPISNFQFQKLHDTLAEAGGDLLIETLPKWIAGTITPKEQEHEKATYTKLLTKEDGHIDWSKSAVEIDRMVRAYNPWPGTWSLRQTEGKPPQRLKILAGHATQEPCSEKPGAVTKKDGQLAVCTGNMLYSIETAQQEGKKPVPARLLVNEGSDFYLE